MSTGKLANKVALVTGSSRGIGAAIAERLAADGAAVAVNYVKAADAADRVAERIRALGGKAIVVRGDVGDWSQAKSLVERTASELGRFDILVNNAADIAIQFAEKITEDEVHRMIRVNVEGPIATTQAAVAHFPEEGGRIINISSLSAFAPSDGSPVYGATKGAIEVFTTQCAFEFGQRGITVNAVAPGLTETGAQREKTPADVIAAITERTPLRRLGQPADIADVVAFVASPDARWVTGQVIRATGGLIP